MQLWNSLVPQLFHLSAITFWQDVGLLVLSKLLFGSDPAAGDAGEEAHLKAGSI